MDGRSADPVTTICYGERDEWDDRWKAIDFYKEAAMGSEGSERERYDTILIKLLAGENECSDGIG